MFCLPIVGKVYPVQVGSFGTCEKRRAGESLKPCCHAMFFFSAFLRFFLPRVAFPCSAFFFGFFVTMYALFVPLDYFLLLVSTSALCTYPTCLPTFLPMYLTTASPSSLSRLFYCWRCWLDLGSRLGIDRLSATSGPPAAGGEDAERGVYPCALRRAAAGHADPPRHLLAAAHRGQRKGRSRYVRVAPNQRFLYT